MASQVGGFDRSRTANDNASRDQSTQRILDEPEVQVSTTEAEIDTPPEPLPLTIDFQPAHLQAKASLLTMSEATAVGDRDLGLPLSLPSAIAVRHSVPGYEILRELGRGGMGVVYQARQKDLNRLVALKMILSGDHAGDGARERFRREAEAVAALQHPHIVQIFEIGEVDGRPYLAFEFIEGGTLAHHLGGNPWSAPAAALLIETLARAVQFAHEHGIVHRDLKPGNILMSRGKDEKSEANRSAAAPKITDFGLAKRVEKSSDWTSGSLEEFPEGQTRTGAVMGTPSYIAPEQAAGKNRDVGPGADIYALGAILYELLTGRPPFRGETPLDTVLQVMGDDPVPPRSLQSKVPRDLEIICLKCLQKVPNKRYATAGELANDLRRFLNHEPIHARPIGLLERSLKWAKRHPAKATSLTISLLALFTMLAISFYFNLKLRRSAEEKENEAAKAREAQLAAEKSALEKDVQTRFANEQKKKADDRLKDVERARKEAEQREEQAQRTAYALALNRAMALVERDPYRAALLLDKKEECPTRFRDFSWQYLRGLCRVVDQRFLDGHTKAITKIAWSPDGTKLATASWDETVRVWDARTHKAIAILRGHRGIVRSVAFAPDGITLATAGSDHLVNFWELPAIKNGGPAVIVHPWSSVEVEDVQTLTISPDGSRAAAGGIDGRIFLFALPSVPRTGLVAVGGSAAGLITRHVEGEPRTAFTLPVKASQHSILVGHREPVTALVWKADGLYSGSHDRTVRRWRPGKRLESDLIFQNSDRILALDVAPDLELLAVAGDSANDASIKVVNMRQQGKDFVRLRGHTRDVNAVTFRADGKFLASASHDGTVRLWEATTGQEASVYRGHKEPVFSVAFSPDQHTLASGGLDILVRFWKLAAPDEFEPELNVRAPLMAATATPDGRTLAAADRDGSIKVWSLVTEAYPRDAAILLRGEIARGLTTLAIDPAGKYVAAGYRDAGVVLVWPLPARGKGKVPAEATVPRSFTVGSDVHDVAMHGNLLAVASRNDVRVWNLATGKLQMEPRTPGINCVAFTPDGAKLVTAGGRPVRVYEIATGREVCHMPFGHVNQDIISVAVGPAKEGNYAIPQPPEWAVVTCDKTGTAQIWRLRDTPAGSDDGPVGRMILENLAQLTGHAEPITSVRFTQHGKTIATTSEDRTIRLWDPIIGRERAALTNHTDSVLTAGFFRDDTALFSMGRDGALKIWRAPK